MPGFNRDTNCDTFDVDSPSPSPRPERAHMLFGDRLYETCGVRSAIGHRMAADGPLPEAVQKQAAAAWHPVMPAVEPWHPRLAIAYPWCRIAPNEQADILLLT